MANAVYKTQQSLQLSQMLARCRENCRLEIPIAPPREVLSLSIVNLYSGPT